MTVQNGLLVPEFGSCGSVVFRLRRGFSSRLNSSRAADAATHQKSAVQGGAAVVVKEEKIVENIQAEPTTCIHLYTPVCLPACLPAAWCEPLQQSVVTGQ